MVIAIVAGPGEGKSGLALWLAERLKKHGASRVTIHDIDTTPETDAQVRDNFEKIVDHVAISQDIHIVTKLKRRETTDKTLVASLEKAGVIEA
jgi:ABC-type transport system involved in cytochrome bd biosynthesis fused ATPase/permease subunit